MSFNHIPVLFKETIENLNINPEGIYVDGTVGGGGHSYEICKHLNGGRLICFDQDFEALSYARVKLDEFKDKVIFVNRNFVDFKIVMESLGIKKIDGMLLDIGVSSYQIDEASRGFSYMHDAKLDMRMNVEQSISAYDVVNNYSIEELTRVFHDYGEENWAKRIAEFIVDKREEEPIETTFQLVEIIEKAIPLKIRRQIKGHSAKKVFQGIRIEVNKELEVIEKVIPDIIDYLSPKGRLCIITFHSLEDRIVKTQFKKLNTGCICPKEIPICVCNQKKRVKIITRKPIEATQEELEQNSRSRSAKLRVVEKI